MIQVKWAWWWLLYFFNWHSVEPKKIGYSSEKISQNQKLAKTVINENCSLS